MIQIQIRRRKVKQIWFLNLATRYLAAFLLPLLLIPGRIHSQDFDHFKPLQSTGTIPEELRTASSKKYARDLEQLGDSARGRAGRVRDNFLLQSNFALDDLLLSGRVIFNDPVSEYVSRVKSLILRNNPELDKKIRIYIVKSPVVNAFATNSGILLVNMGLLAHLKTEAELAFILCHEIQHFVKKHPINNYVKAEEIKSNAKLLGLNTVEDYIAARTGYSRKLELEADNLGYDLYRTSGYSLSAADGVFDLLDNAAGPFDEFPWDASFFEWEFMRFPAEFTKWPLEAMEEEDENDTMSTHPSIVKRRANISAKVQNEKEDNGDAFVIGAETFLNVRKICRFELSELYLAQHAFEEAIYNSYLLLQDESESHYLRKCIAQSIYGLCVYHNSRKFWQTHIDDDDLPGEIQQLLYFTESMDGEAFTIFSLHEVWKTYLRYPDDKELETLSLDLLNLLFTKHFDAAGWLETELPVAMPEPIAKVIAEKVTALQGRDSIGVVPKKETADEVDDGELETEDSNQRYRKKREDKNEYMKWAITDLFQKNLFADAWNERVRAGKTVRSSDEEEEELDEKEYRLKGLQLGIDKVVMVQPIYKEVDLRSKIPVQYLASESSMQDYKSIIADMAQRNDVSLTYLENRSLEAGDVQTFNDVATMVGWFNHYLSEEDANVEMANFSQGEVDELIERYGTKYFAWNALITLTTRLTAAQKMGYIMVGLVYLPALPFLIVKVAKPIKKTMFVTLVFDLETSDLVMENYRILKAKDKRGITKATLFDIFYQIKQSSK